jgi:hypothetical protein
MVRLLSPLLFFAIQGAALAAAAVCRGPICDWAVGGYWVSPAVRVPAVAAAVLLAEIIVLAIAWPGARRGADWFARARHG